MAKALTISLNSKNLLFLRHTYTASLLYLYTYLNVIYRHTIRLYSRDEHIQGLRGQKKVLINRASSHTNLNDDN